MKKVMFREWEMSRNARILAGDNLNENQEDGNRVQNSRTRPKTKLDALKCNLSVPKKQVWKVLCLQFLSSFSNWYLSWAKSYCSWSAGKGAKGQNGVKWWVLFSESQLSWIDKFELKVDLFFWWCQLNGDPFVYLGSLMKTDGEITGWEVVSLSVSNSVHVVIMSYVHLIGWQNSHSSFVFWCF